MAKSVLYDQVSVPQAFKEGGIDIKLSFLIMGFANLVNKQFIKGFLFLISELAFLMAFVITSSVEALITILLAKVLILQPNLSLTLFLNSRYRVNCLFDQGRFDGLFFAFHLTKSHMHFKNKQMNKYTL